MNARMIGDAGEERATGYLIEIGYSIIARNFQSKYGELDIIARDGEVVAIIEVKTRKDASFSDAASNVTRSKQRKIRNTALYWLMVNKFEYPVRFDVIEVYTNGNINHITDAFQ